MNDSLWESIKTFLSEKLYITVTPSSTRNKIKNYSLRRFIPVIVVFVLIVVIGILSSNYIYYRSQYMQTKNNFEEYKSNININELQEENKNLKKNILILSQNTEELRQAMNNLKSTNQEIRHILGEDTNNNDQEDNNEIQITSILDYNYSILKQGIPMGGNNLNLYYYDTDKLLNGINESAEKVEENIKNQQVVQEKLRNDAVEYKELQRSIPTRWPLVNDNDSYISSNFGWRTDPITSQQEYHEGLDIAVWYNTPVIATAAGRVTFVGWKNGYGWSVEIDHGHGYKTMYTHLNEIIVDKGDKVNEGSKIALSGNSGRSTGPHLHYEIRVNGVPKNPRNYIGR
ncbi:MAG: M23 family metallopeptidase [Halanaerobiales bacterium]|nr:M23 family metallopeptidase [Halanaerobiales bacterium]